ncbi:hypothetical protein HMI01_07960 [Halolactibacillus miurensis]|uniref:Tfp pilus assembly protein PilO n=1 Tax=Halolactibacillus miurensis TaxID=306541 RepID=A0A1I6PJQ0_9BACI|nr:MULTISPECIES: hypothetical protein [Halolactibacillus]GEM03808.1 hypothetical protein HMI01_07960 [Halolactibacillus miurensis]SFS40308.1 hypothetical protein SAMN05421668_10218 [Halolactibacillus miurensis]
MIIKWGKNETLIVLIIVAVFGFLFYYGSGYLLDPLHEELEVTEQTLAEHRLVLRQAEMNEQTENALNQEAEAVRNHLPTEEAVDQIVETLFDLETRTGVSITSINLSGAGLTEDAAFYPDGVSAIHYQVTLTSDNVIGIESYMEQLESIDRLIEITELDLTKQSDTQTQAILTIRAFYNESILIE